MRKNVFVILGAVLLATSAAAETVSGVVEAIDRTRVTVSGRTFAIERTSEMTDLSGERIDLAEVRPGTAVEIDLDDAGHLGVLRAAVVR
jgi:hypothetical protein